MQKINSIANWNLIALKIFHRCSADSFPLWLNEIINTPATLYTITPNKVTQRPWDINNKEKY